MDKLNEAMDILHNMQRNRRFKKANLDRAEKTALLTEIAKCNGKLNSCMLSFRSTIKEQSKHIAEGRTHGFDTITQEQIMWDAAIGYMLVVDAMYALKSVGSYDSVTRAYGILDAAAMQMSGKKSGLAKGRGNAWLGRNDYDYINSFELVESKKALLDGFFNELKLTGDIEACLANAKHPSDLEAERRDNYAGSGRSSRGSGGLGEYNASLDAISDQDATIDYSNLSKQNVLNFTPPKIEKTEESVPAADENAAAAAEPQNADVQSETSSTAAYDAFLNADSDDTHAMEVSSETAED